MTKLIVFLLIGFISTASSAQISAFSWSEEIKLNKGSLSFKVIGADQDGFFVQESHQVLKSYFVLGYTARDVAKLIRFDKTLSEVYSTDFAKELKGKEFERFLFVKSKLYIIADEFDKKTRTIIVYFAELDKATGALKGDWSLLQKISAEDKNKAIQYKFDYSSDSSNIVFVSTIEGEEKNNYSISILDNNLKFVRKYPVIINEFDPKTFVLEDVFVVSGGQVMILGREHEYAEGKRKKDKFLQFKNYNTRIYNTEGKLIKEIKTDLDNRWMVNSKAIVNNNEIMLASFYSNDSKKKEINGLVVFRIDPATGNVISNNNVELTKGMVSTEEEDDDDKKKKKDDDDEGLVANLKFRALIGGPNNAIVIFAESETSYMKSFTTTSNNGASTTRSYLEYKCGDIYAAKIEANGKIGWFSIFPKRQWERIPGGVSVGSAPSVSGSYFLSRVDKPYYASYGVAAINNKAFLIFNDNTKNAAVTKAGQTVKSTKDFDKADCYSLEVNLATGQMKRRSLFSNNDIPNAMPKHGIQLGNNFYLIGKKEQSIGKTKLVVGRGTIK